MRGITRDSLKSARAMRPDCILAWQMQHDATDFSKTAFACSCKRFHCSDDLVYILVCCNGGFFTWIRQEHSPVSRIKWFTYCNQRSHLVDVVLIKLTRLSFVDSDSSDMVAADDVCDRTFSSSVYKFVLRMCARDAQNGTFGKIAPRLKPGSMTLPATVLKSLQRPTHFDSIAVFPEA